MKAGVGAYGGCFCILHPKYINRKVNNLHKAYNYRTKCTQAKPVMTCICGEYLKYLVKQLFHLQFTLALYSSEQQATWNFYLMIYLLRVNTLVGIDLIIYSFRTCLL